MHYTTSCNTQSSAPEDGRDHRLKRVELIGIINKPLLLHLVGVYIIYVDKQLTMLRGIIFIVTEVKSSYDIGQVLCVRGVKMFKCSELQRLRHILYVLKCVIPVVRVN